LEIRRRASDRHTSDFSIGIKAVPEGILIIARRFNAGNWVGASKVPKGRLKIVEFKRPVGTPGHGRPKPGVETPGCYLLSRRDAGADRCDLQ
jgi:hypothetical protein